MHQQLMWYRRNFPLESVGQPLRGPSWSWISTSGAVVYPGGDEMHIKYNLEIVDCKTETSNSFCSLRGSHIRSSHRHWPLVTSSPGAERKLAGQTSTKAERDLV